MEMILRVRRDDDALSPGRSLKSHLLTLLATIQTLGTDVF